MFLPLLCVCCGENSENGESITPSYNMTYVRFVSSVGTNVLDSLQIMADDVKMADINSDLITIDGKRESDGLPLEMQNYWFYASPQADDIFEKEETLLKIGWVDFNIWNIEKRPYKYNDTYEIRMRSLRIFGDSNTHILKWFITVSGREHDAFKCDFDEKEISLSNDPFYNQRIFYNNHEVAALVTVVCK